MKKLYARQRDYTLPNTNIQSQISLWRLLFLHVGFNAVWGTVTARKLQRRTVQLTTTFQKFAIFVIPMKKGL